MRHPNMAEPFIAKADSPQALVDYLRSMINPAYVGSAGTASHERQRCVDAIEGLARELAQRDPPETVCALKATVLRLDEELARIRARRPVLSQWRWKDDTEWRSFDHDAHRAEIESWIAEGNAYEIRELCAR